MNKWARYIHTDVLILLMLGFLAVAGPLLGHPLKFDRSKKIGFASMIPASMGEWQKVSIKEHENLPEELDINELYQAMYSHPDYGLVALTLEYTSDSRREFELHYPDICHTIRGDLVITHPPRRLDLSDGYFIDVSVMDWQQRNEGYNALTAYWYVTRDGVTIDSRKLKIKQALAGLFNRPEEAVMVRLDAFYEQASAPNKRVKLFEAIAALSRRMEGEVDIPAKTLIFKRLTTEEI